MTTESEVAPGQSAYVVGAILEHSWGYEQTNIDYFLVVRRKGLWLWVVPIGKKNVTPTGFMSGTCEPDPANILDPKPIRRKLHVWQGQERGIAIERSYGWCDVWNGKPSHWTAYA
jgi:hypothetical protein